QVEWKITKYYSKEPSEESKIDTICKALPSSLEQYYISPKSWATKSQDWARSEGDRRALDKTLETTDLSAYQLDNCLHIYPDELLHFRPGEVLDDMPQYPTTLGMILTNSGCPVSDKNDSSVHALDIIPRQSTLNINEHHATVKNVGILG